MGEYKSLMGYHWLTCCVHFQGHPAPGTAILPCCSGLCHPPCALCHPPCHMVPLQQLTHVPVRSRLGEKRCKSQGFQSWLCFPMFKAENCIYSWKQSRVKAKDKRFVSKCVSVALETGNCTECWHSHLAGRQDAGEGCAGVVPHLLTADRCWELGLKELNLDSSFQ